MILVRRVSCFFLFLALFFSAGYSISFNISNCSILNVSGATYYLNQSILNSVTSYCINISGDNIVLDCRGNTIDGNDIADYGIYISRSIAYKTNITIRNCSVSDWDTANIYINNANNNTIYNVTSFSSPDYGFFLINSKYNSFLNVSSNYNTYGIYLSGSYYNSLYNTFSSHNSYGIYFYYSNNNNIILTKITSNPAGGVAFVSSLYNTLDNLSSLSDGYGVALTNSHYNTVSNLSIINATSEGVYVSGSSSNKILKGCISGSSKYDLEVSPSSVADCNFVVANITNQKGYPLIYSNRSIIVKDKRLSELVLCNASYSNINNVTIIGSSTILNNGLFTYYTSYSNFTNINSSNNYDGIYLSSQSTHNLFKNILVNSNSYAGFEIYSLSGYYLSNDDYNSLNNITANGNNYGIYFLYSNKNNLNNLVSVASNSEGVLLSHSSYNSLYNIFVSNSVLSYDSGIELSSSNNNFLENITSISNSGNGIRIYGNNNLLVGLVASSNSGDGIYISSSSNSTLKNIYSHDNSKDGVYNVYSFDTSLLNGTIYSNVNAGLYSYYSKGGSIFDIKFGYGSTYGIYMAHTNYSIIRNCIINNNSYYGIYLGNSYYNRINNSIIRDNVLCGIYETYSGSNLIYNNIFNNVKNFCNGTVYVNNFNVSAITGPNIVAGPYIGGNFWGKPNGTGYSQTCSDANGDGFCDLPYTLATGNIDYLPLVPTKPFYVYPTPNNGNLISRPSLFFNVNLNGNSPVACYLNINGATYTMNINTTSCYYNLTILPSVITVFIFNVSYDNGGGSLSYLDTRNFTYYPYPSTPIRGSAPFISYLIVPFLILMVMVLR